eukprot:g2555.t1
MHLNPEAAGSVIFEYANASMQTVNMEEDEYDGSPVTVESSPMYMFYPLAPFRMAMVQPHAKLVVVLKDPTARVAAHLGLPPHTYTYDPRHQHSSGACSRERPEYFAEDGRYGKMLKDEALFREWYRPHNQRLYALIGRDLGWD